MVKNPKPPSRQPAPNPTVADEGDATAETPSEPAVLAKSDHFAAPVVYVPPPDAIQSPVTWTRWIWAGGLAATFAAAAALWYFQPWVSTGLAVTIETVTPGPLMRVLAVNGRVAPLHRVDVKSTVGGEVMAVLVDEGGVVTLGDVLARVDPIKQQAAVRQAKAGLEAGLVAQAQADANFARAKALGGIIARTALEDARTVQQQAAQEVARMTALFDQAQIELAKYTMVAPMAGTVLNRNAEVGQVIDATVVMFTVADLAQLVVETDVDEAYAAQIIPGLPAVLQLTGETAKLEGSVSFVAPQVDAATGGLAVKIALDKPVAAPVGLTVTANIIVDSQDAAISVPRAALVTDATGAAVFVAVANQAVRRAVTVVNWPAARLQVTQGLTAGEAVITDATGLSDGKPIAVPGP